MDQTEITAFGPDPPPADDITPLELARRAMHKAGCMSGNQQMGSRWPIGCVALEITQRCNLDCTLCYLSEHSEAVKDIPLEEVFRRIELIRRHYGVNTDVQITGGEPTLRKRDELIAIVRRIRTASFHAQAATGRGVHEKKRAITLDMVTAQIERGAGTRIDFRSSLAGHPQCNRYGLCLVVNGRLYDALDESGFIARMQAATAHLVFDRAQPRRVIKDFLVWLCLHPRHWSAALKWSVGKAWQMKNDLLAARGHVGTLSFFVHGFMDAGALERERIEACVFKTMTADGPLSMCLHNVKRDSFILQPIAVYTSAGRRFWQPLSGALNSEPVTVRQPDPRQYGHKRAKGRVRAALRVPGPG